MSKQSSDSKAVGEGLEERSALLKEIEHLRGEIERLDLQATTHSEQADQPPHCSQEVFEKVFQSQRDALLILDSSTPPRIVDCNQAARRIFGYSRGELLGRPITFLHISPDAHADFHARLDHKGAGQKYFSDINFQMRKKDGAVFPTEHTVMPLGDGPQDRTGWVSLVRDISGRQAIEEIRRQAKVELEKKFKERTRDLKAANQRMLAEIHERKKADSGLRRNTQFIERVMDSASNAIFALDLEGRFMRVNRRVAQISGYKTSELLGKHFSMVVPPRQLPDILELFRNTVGEGMAVRNRELELIRKDGSKRTIAFSANPLRQDGKIISVVGTAEDITERVRLERYQRMAATVFQHSREGIVVTNAEGVIQMVNAAYSEITGYGAGELVGTKLELLGPQTGDDCSAGEIRQALGRTAEWDGEHWGRRKDGEAFSQWLTVSAIRVGRDQVTGYMAIFRDLSNLMRSQKRLRHLAFHDPLTALPNRLLLEDRLSQALAHAKRNGTIVALLFVDLDRFKEINDTWGHEVGDEVLKEAAARLKESVRQEDTVARLGGDEFLIVLGELQSASGAAKAAAVVLDSLVKPVTLGERDFKVAASIGISLYPEHGADPNELIRRADQAMYEAKTAGRGGQRIFSPGSN